MGSQCNEPNRAICNNGSCTDTKTIFITTTQTDGNLGGLAGADALCQSEATSAAYSGTFKAWLSTSGTGGQSAAQRMVQHNLPYVRFNRNKIADNFADLVDGSLDVSIFYTWQGLQVTGPVWTGTIQNGAAAASTCNNWTSATSTVNGLTGLSSTTDMTWSNNLLTACNAGNPRLICIEQ